MTHPSQPGPSAPETGEPRDLAELYLENAQFVWRNLRRLGVPDDSLEDAVQDVFLVAHRRLAEFAGRSTLRTWLFGIVARVAARRRQRLRRAVQLFLPSSPELLERLVADAQRGPLDLLVQRQATDLVHRLLSELDDDKQTMIVMVELEQMSVAEAAQVLGLNINTAHSRLRAARRLFEALFRRTLVAAKAAS